jgi:hypothetical protein
VLDLAGSTVCGAKKVLFKLSPVHGQDGSAQGRVLLVGGLDQVEHGRQRRATRGPGRRMQKPSLARRRRRGSVRRTRPMLQQKIQSIYFISIILVVFTLSYLQGESIGPPTGGFYQVEHGHFYLGAGGLEIDGSSTLIWPIWTTFLRGKCP